MKLSRGNKNCTNHFLKRWVERVVGITTEKEINEHITKNRDQLIEHANKTFEYAQHIYKGQIGDNQTRNYHIKDNLIFVTNTTDDAFITIYEVDLGFTDELNTTVRKGLIKEIERLTADKEEAELQIIDEMDDIEHTITSLEEEIKILEEQQRNLKREKEFKIEELKQLKKKTLNVGLEIKKHVLTLVNSRAYKEDLQSMK